MQGVRHRPLREEHPTSCVPEPLTARSIRKQLACQVSLCSITEDEGASNEESEEEEICFSLMSQKSWCGPDDLEVPGLGFRGLGFRGLGFRDAGTVASLKSGRPTTTAQLHLLYRPNLWKCRVASEPVKQEITEEVKDLVGSLYCKHSKKKFCVSDKPS